VNGVKRLTVVGAILLAGCESLTIGNRTPVIHEFDLTTAAAAAAWTGGFADYPVGEEEMFELVAEPRVLPHEVERTGQGFHLAGTNRSDDLFMFMKRRVGGLRPNRVYRATFRVEFATEAPSGCVGVGGPPGEAVWVKAGATAEEPVPVVDQVGTTDYYAMNVDKGNQAVGGSDAVVLGDIANTNTDCLDWRWEMKTLQSERGELEVTADGQGRVWLLIGTDSGFESRTRLYYASVRAEFEPR
jgi:hypothetical protein